MDTLQAIEKCNILLDRVRGRTISLTTAREIFALSKKAYPYMYRTTLKQIDNTTMAVVSMVLKNETVFFIVKNIKSTTSNPLQK